MNATPVLIYKELFDASLDAIVCSNETGLITLWNDAAEKMFGYSADEAVGQPLTILMTSDDQQRHNAGLKRFINTGEACISGTTVEVSALAKDGKSFPVEFALSSRKTECGWLFFAILRDVSERKQTAAIVEMVATGQPASNIYDAIALMYEARHPGMRCSMLELKGDKLMHAGAPSLPEAYCRAVNGLQYGSNIGSCGTSTYTGKRVLVEDIATDSKWTELKSMALSFGLRSCWSEPIKSATGEVLGAFGMYYNHPALPNEQESEDLMSAARLAGIVMERERRELALRKFSSVIEQAGESVVITDRNGVIEYINPAFTKLTGYSWDEAIGHTPRILKSGNQDAAFYKIMWETITSGKVWHGKVIDRKKNGSFYPAMLTISPVFDGDGCVTHYTHFVGLQSDLTEIDHLEKQFYQAQKMEAMGTLVGGIAHDFNNMLAGMNGNIYLAKRAVQAMPDVLQKLENIERIAARSSDMIQQLLTFARKDEVHIKPIPFTLLIKETFKLLRPSVPENIAMHVDICADALQVRGDATLLHQVLMNLINNARDALENVNKPCITIRLEAFHADDAFVLNRKDSNFKLGVYAHLSVADNGCGVPAHQLQDLFEPFFTTKEQGKGTGLGLAMVFGAMKTHDGFVEVDSSVGKGTTFHIYIPLLKPEAIDAHAIETERIEAIGSGELILLVDDERCVTEPGAEVLEALGYRVLVARDGQQAVDLFTAYQKEVRLIILDVVMPLMSGDKVAQLIRQMNPHVKIIFSTAYDKRTQTELSNEIVLNKPFSIIEMSQLVRQQLKGY